MSWIVVRCTIHMTPTLMLMPSKIPPCVQQCQLTTSRLSVKDMTMTNSKLQVHSTSGWRSGHAQASPCVNVTFLLAKDAPLAVAIGWSGLLLANSTLIGSADWPTRGARAGLEGRRRRRKEGSGLHKYGASTNY